MHIGSCRVAAALVSGDRTGAYDYLPKSVVSFCDPKEISQRLQQVGFVDVTRKSLTLGVVTLHRARRSP